MLANNLKNKASIKTHEVPISQKIVDADICPDFIFFFKALSRSNLIG